MEKINVIPLIPSLNPDEKMIKYIKELIEIGFKKIIIVNDGSSKKYDHYFDEIDKLDECVILKHAVNQGKGRALKTGFNYYLNNFSDYDGVVTADSDGQHSVKDTMKVAKSLSKNKKSLILGTRDFNEEQVPFKSKYGNKITTLVFKLLYGKKINDTQTGLRGIPNNFIENCITLSGERFEYEINMLISCVKNNIKIKEEIIETIYIEENKSSHFNPIKDSIRIYKILFTEFFKFTFSGIFSFIVDILIFSFLINFVFFKTSPELSIFLSTLVARIISSMINYLLNKNVVFDCDNNNKLLILKYYSLCVIQMCASSIFTTLLFKTNIFNEVISKTIVDLILFFISFNVQKKYIFKKVNK